MDDLRVRTLLEHVFRGEVSVEDALRKLQRAPVDDLGFAKVDQHRALRRGFPEVVFGEGKTPTQVLGIVERLIERHNSAIVTRVSPELAEAVTAQSPLSYHSVARMLTYEADTRVLRGRGPIAVLTGGTSDIPVAEEAALTAEVTGNEVVRIFDVGVAGLHRLLAYVERLREMRVIIAVAGMEGALPSVVAGLVDCPVIAVPTSVGYGASFGGIAPLLATLNSCAAGVTVVNIDNGFGAGYAAALMNRSRERDEG